MVVCSEIYQHLKINTKGRFKKKMIVWYKILISTFLVELHQDDDLEVLLVVGVEFLSYELNTKERFTEQIVMIDS